MEKAPEKSITKSYDTLEEFITNSPKFKFQIQNALPKHFDPERFSRILTTEIRRNPKILKCTRDSVLGAFIQCAQLGLEPGDGRNLIHLIPYEDKKKKFFECQVQIGYKGMIELATRSGKIDLIIPRAVYEKDIFEFEYGFSEKLKHIPYIGEDGKGKLIAVYAVATLKSGKMTAWVMPKCDIDDIRKTSKTAQFSWSPWNLHYDAMGLKTVIKKLCKYLPESSEDLGRAISLDDKADIAKQDLAGEYKMLTEAEEDQPKEPEEPEIPQNDHMKEILKQNGMIKE